MRCLKVAHTVSETPTIFIRKFVSLNACFFLSSGDNYIKTVAFRIMRYAMIGLLLTLAFVLWQPVYAHYWGGRFPPSKLQKEVSVTISITEVILIHSLSISCSQILYLPKDKTFFGPSFDLKEQISITILCCSFLSGF